ncbi:hypothetical protein OHA04_27500 [Streptomyces sp. NBC_01590]|uniref:hypothetical protein n=1 Tax=Streptomyces sp. NBC_01590 TaxID=2975887 RepID=UPI003866E1DF
MSHNQHEHPAQCCCCARAATQAATEEREPFRLADLADVPRTQWIGGGIMFLVVAILILARHA